jgi:ribosomal protein S18 acetylase RimI-like enzyme
MARMELCIDDVNYYFRMARDDTGYVGAVCGSVAPFFFSPSLMGVEDAWYVREGTPNRAAIAMRLMRGFVDWCLDDKGAVLVQTGDIASIDTLAVDTLYRRMGFTRFGTVYKFVRTT